jgi:hypothetical protein
MGYCLGERREHFNEDTSKGKHIRTGVPVIVVKKLWGRIFTREGRGRSIGGASAETRRIEGVSEVCVDHSVVMDENIARVDVFMSDLPLVHKCQSRS